MKSRALLAAVLSAATFAGFVMENHHAAAAVIASSPALSQQVPGKGLLPRRLVRKPASSSIVLPHDPVTGAPIYNGTIVLKFRDDVGARSSRGGSPAPFSMTGATMDGFNQILVGERLTVRQWINRSTAELANLEERARVHSGREQPDLAGVMMIEDVPTDRLVEVTRAINALPEIEFAVIDRIPQLHQCGPADPAIVPIQSGQFQANDQRYCNRPIRGVDAPQLGGCTPAVPPDDGCNSDPGDTDQDVREFIGCADTNCCALISGTIPYCGDSDQAPGWNLICAVYANVFCTGTIYDSDNPGLAVEARYDPCLTNYQARNGHFGTVSADPAIDLPVSATPPLPPLNDDPVYEVGDGTPPLEAGDPELTEREPTGYSPIFANVATAVQSGGCTDVHPGHGCRQPLCCYSVCLVDAACCSDTWDQTCVNIALTLPDCVGSAGSPDPTPDFAPVKGTGANAARIVAGEQLYIQPLPAARGLAGGVVNEDFVSPTLFDGRGLDIPAFEQLQFDVAINYQGGIEPSLRGQGIRVGVVEFGCFVNHEEFTVAERVDNPIYDPSQNTLLAQPKVIPEPGQTILLIEGSNNDPQHGTAALSVIVGADNDYVDANGAFLRKLGMEGIAKNAQGYMFPIVSVEEGSRSQNAMISCMTTFRAGDVMNNSWGLGGQPLPTAAQYYLLIGMATDLGITTVCSAGNSNCPVGAEAGEASSGAIIVGASHSGRRVPPVPTPPGQQLCNGYDSCGNQLMRAPFSNFGGDTAVTVFAWGENVLAAGYGDVFTGDNTSSTQALEDDQLRTYTWFSGTSSAAPMISGAVANIQAFAKQIYGNPLSPGSVLGVMTGNGRAQCAAAVSPDNCPQPGPDCCIIGDPDCDGIFKDIGVFPLMYDVGVGIFTTPNWSDEPTQPNDTDIRLVRGIQVPGYAFNSLMIRAQDAQAIRIETVRARAGINVEDLTYIGTGASTDVQASLLPPLQDPANEITDISLRYVSRATTNFSLLLAAIKNFETNRWEYFGNNLLTIAYPLAPQGFSIPQQGGYSKYLNPTSGKIEVRIVTFGLGNTQTHQIHHDLIYLNVNDPFQPL